MRIGLLQYCIPIALAMLSWFISLGDPFSIFFSILVFSIFVLLVIRNKGLSLIAFFVFSSIYLLLLALDAFQFTYLPQLRGYIHLDPFEMLAAGDKWAPRFLVSYPSILLSNILDIDLDFAFTIYNIGLFLIMMFLLLNIGKIVRPKYAMVFLIVSILSFVFLSFIMNGRLIAAFLGITIILYIQIKAIWRKNGIRLIDYLLMVIGCFISTVSSGTMIVAFVQLFMGSFVVLKITKKKVRYLVLYLGLFLGAFGTYLIVMINKNLDFFGGGLAGLINMFHHGIGVILFLNKWIVLVFTFMVCLFVWIYVKLFKQVLKNEVLLMPILVSIPICFSSGMFGFSTALMIVPSMIILSCYSIIFVITFLKNKEIAEEE
ncbi:MULTISPECIES: hypothetical protein [unclassified Brevibacillus]|uniref:hypothetical protein n=1 Tax=unclassified Brevibacillus TaxID=2684853 RepID=UPI0035648A09